MIQSSQPISLKLTWSRLRWQRSLAFTVWCWDMDSGARLIRRWVNRYSSRFLLFPNAKKKAFSLLVLPCRANPRVRRSMGRPPPCSSTSSSKHSSWECWPFWVLKPLNTFQTSNTSHVLLNRSSTAFIWTRTAFCLPEVQVCSLRSGDGTPPPSPPLRFLRMCSSAPRSPSRSRELMLKRYLCRRSWGPRSSVIRNGSAGKYSPTGKKKNSVTNFSNTTQQVRTVE
uniref:Uncharacterized protein n=1 Tax=Haplochromis burtoni TaxID=8153 RepID=A0A3Q2VJ34_HAPBU